MNYKSKIATKMIGVLLGLTVLTTTFGCTSYYEQNDNIVTSDSKVESTVVTTSISTMITTSTIEGTTASTETTSSSETVVDVRTTDNEEETDTSTVTTEEIEVNQESTTVVTELTKTSFTTVITKTNTEIAQEVIDGKWGSGEERKNKLINAGYNYDDIQKEVNKILNSITTTTTTVTSSEQTSDDNYNEDNNTNTSYGTSFVKTFSRGTYYAYGGPRYGGSGRNLIDCSYGDGTVRGSIASSYLYYNYGYNYNGKRTMVYLEVYGYPDMNGYYYLDDSDAGNYNVIDFFYLYNSNCPFQRQGVVTVDCYIVNY